MRKSFFSVLLISFLFGVLCLLPANAQERKGAITGNVTDISGGVLKGAQVSLEPEGANVVSDVQGGFLINDLDPGSYTITITYVGLAPFKKTVEVRAGQTVNVEAKLEVQSQSQSVLVTAPRPSAEVAAINQERTADNIVQVLPAEVIRSLPNANMADALGRLPSVTLERDEGEGKYVQIRGTEPRLTNTTIDGMNLPSPESGVRQIKFDAIPSDIVESVEVNKTLQANMDGDGIGGSVNLVTKTATNTPSIAIGGMGGYTPIVNGRGLTEDTGTIGQRFGSSKKFGILVGGSYDWNGRGIDDIEPVSDVATFPDGSTKLWKDAMDIREYRYYRSRWGVAGSADYRVGQGSDIYLRYLYSDFKNYGDRWVYSLTDNTPIFNPLNPSEFPNAPTLFGSNGCSIDTDPTSATYKQETCGSGTAASFNSQIRRPDYALGSLLLGGSHVLTTTWFSWDLSVGRSHETDNGYGTVGFTNSTPTSACQYDPANTANEFLPRWTAACYTESYSGANLFMDPNNGGISINNGQSAQLNLQAAGAGAKRYHIGSHLATIEIGGKFRNEHKFDEFYTVSESPVGTIPLTQFPNRLINTSYYNGGNYNLGYNANYTDVLAYANAHPSAFTSSSSQGMDPQDFTYVEKISSGYLMNTIDFSSRLRFIAGVRFEGTDLTGRNFSVGDTGITPNNFGGSYLTILPSASLRYALGANTDLRFVYGRGLSRPDPQDIASAVTWTAVGNGSQKNQVSLNNPNLMAEIGDDVDVLFEHYLNPFGLISAGYFYKHLSNPIVTQDSILTNYLPAGAPAQDRGTWDATQPINAGSAWISGFEANYIQHLSFLPGAWGGLGISANYGFTTSRVSGLPGRSDRPRLLRNAPNTWNISPTYDRGRVSIRVGLSYNQNSIYAYQYSDGTPGGVNGPLSDIYFYSHIQLDAEGSILLKHGLRFVMYGLDLNNGVFGFYQGSPQYMIQREYYQPTVAAGFRWSPATEK